MAKPTVLSPDELNLGPAKIAVCGTPGIGKSSLLGTFPDIVVLDAEYGSGSIKAWRHQIPPGPNCLQDTIRLFKKISKSPMVDGHLNYEIIPEEGDTPAKIIPVRAIGIDTMDMIQLWEKQKILGSKVRMEQQDWGELLDRMMPLLTEILLCPVHVIVAVHSKEIPGEGKGSASEFGFDFQGSYREKFPSFFSEIVSISPGDDEDERRIIWQPTPIRNRDGNTIKYIGKDRHNIFEELERDGHPYTKFGKVDGKIDRSIARIIYAKHTIRAVEVADLVGTPLLPNSTLPKRPTGSSKP